MFFYWTAIIIMRKCFVEKFWSNRKSFGKLKMISNHVLMLNLIKPLDIRNLTSNDIRWPLWNFRPPKMATKYIRDRNKGLSTVYTNLKWWQLLIGINRKLIGLLDAEKKLDLVKKTLGKILLTFRTWRFIRFRILNKSKTNFHIWPRAF